MDNARLQHKRDRQSASLGVAHGRSFDPDAAALAVVEGEPRASYTVKDKNPEIADRQMHLRVATATEADPNTAAPASAGIFGEASLISDVLWHVDRPAAATADIYVWALTEVEPGLHKWILVDTVLAVVNLSERRSPTRMRPVFFQFGNTTGITAGTPASVRASLGV